MISFMENHPFLFFISSFIVLGVLVFLVQMISEIDPFSYPYDYDD